MARRRTRKRNDSDTETGSGTTETTNESKGGKKLMGLSAEQIQALLGKTRQKGLYVQRLNEFLASGEMGISAKETWVEFRDKKDTTLKQGFDNAKDNKEAAEGSDMVKVVVSDDDVYLINLSLAGAELEPAAA
jgi:hypothetical protein